MVQAEAGDLMTVREVAALLRVSRATVYRLVQAGELQVVRISNSIRVPTEAFERALFPWQKVSNDAMP